MLDFSRQGKKKKVGNSCAKHRDVVKEKGEENSRGVVSEAEERKCFGQHGHFDHVLFLCGGENLGREAIKLLQAKKSL